MKSLKVFATVFCLAVAATATMAFMDVKSLKKSKTEGKGFAVIELFTSEGCSSCPPADELVARVQKEVSDQPVYILAFHVDYWNSASWKDAFSDHEYSERQKQYTQWLNLQSAYTPQIVVNGRTEFVGSEEASLRNAIKANLQISAKAELTLSDVKINGSKASLKYHIAASTNNSSLILALIEKNATTNVKGGENNGRTLSNVQIVRELKTSTLNSSNGSKSIPLPHDFTAEKWEVIGFVQDNATGEILGAAKAVFAPVMSESASK